MCSPCFSQLLCLWHVGRSTPTPSLAALALAVTSVLLGDYNLSLIIDSLSGCGLRVSASLYDAYRVAHALVLVIDCLMVLFSALLTGLTREIFCLCVYRTGVFDFDNILGGGGGGSGSFSSVGRSDDDAPQLLVARGTDGEGERTAARRASAAPVARAAAAVRCSSWPLFCRASASASAGSSSTATCAAFVARLANRKRDDEEDTTTTRTAREAAAARAGTPCYSCEQRGALHGLRRGRRTFPTSGWSCCIVPMLVAAHASSSPFFSIMVDNRRVAVEQATCVRARCRGRRRGRETSSKSAGAGGFLFRFINEF